MPLADVVQIVADRSGGVMKLAAMVGVDPAALYHWTRIPARHAERISEATGIPIEQLITGRIEEGRKNG